MKEYKMGRGEYIEDRAPDLKKTIEEYFGTVTGTETVEGNELYVVEDPDNPVFERILAGRIEYGSKKDTLGVDFIERPPEEVLSAGLGDAAAEAVSAKNDFLLEVTGRDAKARRDSMKREVEDSDEDVSDV